MLFFATCIQCICTTRGLVLWGQDVCSKDQSYRNTMQYKDPPYGSCAKDQLIQWEYAVCTKDQFYGGMMHATKDQSYGTVHVATRRYVQSQVALYHVRGPVT